MLVVGVLALPSAAGAQGVFGTVQLQYQNTEEDIVRLSGDGSRFAERVRRESWLRTVDMHHQSLLRSNLLLESNLRISGTNLLGTGNGTSTPLGGFRLMHPYMQLSATHSPTSTKTTLAERTGVSADSTSRRTITAKTAETALTGHFAVPRLPAVDVSWTRHRRESVASAVGEGAVTRNARMSWDRERYSVYGMYGDTRQKSDASGAPTSQQRLWNAGGSYRIAPVKDATLGLQYDFGSARTRSGSTALSSTQTQSANLVGDWRARSWMMNSMSALWRRTDVGNPNVKPTSDLEGALLTRWSAGSRAAWTSGAGVRTVRVLQESKLQKYVTSMAAADGELRAGWAVNGSASHTTTWDPERAVFGTETVAASTRATISRTTQLDASWQLAASGDSASTQSRYNNSWSARLQTSPLRSLTLSLSLRSLRVGPGLFEPYSVANGSGLDVQWRVMPRLEFVGTFASNANGAARSQTTTTRAVSAKLEPSARFQLYGSYTRSDQAATVVTNAQRLRQESASGRVQWQPTRRIAASSTLTIQQPGHAEEARQLDVAFTWSFGR
ncbi:MAG: hypothetical protein U0704_02135 [Candidatus Eisenbacteria bacterium]